MIAIIFDIVDDMNKYVAELNLTTSKNLSYVLTLQFAHSKNNDWLYFFHFF
jgi:hypothetical protein